MVMNHNRITPNLPVVAGLPIDLYESMEGNFFAGSAATLCFGGETGAWAGLFNPYDSGVDLYVWAFGISDIANTAYRIQIWFNALFPGESKVSDFVSSTNTAVNSKPKVILKYGSQVKQNPVGGIKAFVRRSQAATNIMSIEDGKFIFPPGGNFTIFLSNPETPDIVACGEIHYQWWEVKK